MSGGDGEFESWRASGEFIRNEIASGRYGSPSEVVRDALRELKKRKYKLGGTAVCIFVSNYSVQGLIQELYNEG
ncbi:ribbon-helix-helix domain-containing protein [Methylomonas koyamae]|uniref:ribbon-helix-helix domain-containing protein n=1 Tax=Methylomonas koyamae TaxID=702114 RepID=UPI0035BF9C9A